MSGLVRVTFVLPGRERRGKNFTNLCSVFRQMEERAESLYLLLLNCLQLKITLIAKWHILLLFTFNYLFSIPVEDQIELSVDWSLYTIPDNKLLYDFWHIKTQKALYCYNKIPSVLNFFFLIIIIFFWLHLVLVVAHAFSSCGEWGPLFAQCTGLPLWWPLPLQSMGSSHTGLSSCGA